MNATHTIGYLVWRLSMQWRTAIDRTVKPLGITHATYTVLTTLLARDHDQGITSQRELAAHLGMSVVYISKLVTVLERAGLVERAPHPHDVRANALSLSPEGRTVAHAAISLVHPLLEELASPLGGTSTDQAQVFKRDLLRLIDHAMLGGSSND